MRSGRPGRLRRRRRLGRLRDRLRALLRLASLSATPILTVVLLTVILTINRRLRNHRGRLRLLDLRLCLWGQLRTLRRLLLPAASLPENFRAIA